MDQTEHQNTTLVANQQLGACPLMMVEERELSAQDELKEWGGLKMDAEVALFLLNT